MPLLVFYRETHSYGMRICEGCHVLPRDAILADCGSSGRSALLRLCFLFGAFILQKRKGGGRKAQVVSIKSGKCSVAELPDITGKFRRIVLFLPPPTLPALWAFGLRLVGGLYVRRSFFGHCVLQYLLVFSTNDVQWFPCRSSVRA
jgi:hypothetical protein